MNKISFVIAYSVLAIGFPLSSSGAVLYMSPEYQQVYRGSTFVSELWVDTEGESINAVLADVSYPVNILEVVDVNTGGSAFSLYPEDPIYSNETGSFVLQAAVPRGLEGKGLIGKIFFHAIATGEAAVRYSEKSAVLLNDGFGTAAVRERKQADYTVFERSDRALDIISPQYTSETIWFQDSYVLFEWNAKNDASYSYTITKDPLDFPDEIADTAEGTAEFTLESDGIFYFHVRECAEGVCGLSSTRRIMKDAQAPEPFEIHLGRARDAFEGKAFLSFFTTDKTSGIDHYEILKIINETEGIWEAEVSPYVLSDKFSGGVIQIKAVDKAGNEQIASLAVENSEIAYKNYLIFGIIIGIGIFLLYAVFWARTLILRKKEKYDTMR